MILASVIFFLFLVQRSQSAPQWRSFHHPTSLVKRDPAPLTDRAVYLSIACDFTYKEEWRDSADTLNSNDFLKVASHPLLEIVGDGHTNGNIRIELSLVGRQMAALVQDYGINNPMVAPESRWAGGRFVRVRQVGTVRINNQDILDPATGKGVVSDIWARDTTYGSISHNCIDFMGDVVAELKIPPSADFAAFHGNHISTNTGPAASKYDIKVENCPVVGVKKVGQMNPRAEDIWFYDVAPGKDPALANHISVTGEPEPVEDFTTAQKVTVTKDGIERQMSSASEIRSYAGSDIDAEINYFVEQVETGVREVIPGPDELARQSTSGSSSGTATNRNLAVKGSAEVTLIRAGGVSRAIFSVAKGVLMDAGGVAGIALLPLFVILDLVNGQWTAAAVGAVGGALGLAAALLISGPLGLFVGAAIGVFFAIFPGLFTEKSPPPSDNAAQVIQFAFFGDKGHTGNEGCNKQRAMASPPQSQNCTAVYGAGTLSHIFKWSIFDAIVFLIVNNGGQQMSIPDMAAVLPVKDYTQSNWTTTRAMYIDCGPAPRPQPLMGNPGGHINGYVGPSMTPRDGYDCKSPKFILNRSLVRLPVLNDTADKIYNRIIPAPGGDCKLLSDPTNGFRVPFLDVIVTGRSVGIACNLNINTPTGVDPSLNYGASGSYASSNITTYSSGTNLVIYNPLTNTTSNYTSLGVYGNSTGSASIFPTGTASGSAPATTVPVLPSNTVIATDNSTLRGYRTPPPPKDFTMYNASNSVCFSGPNQYLCLPDGDFDTCDGSLGFNSKTTTSITFPSVAPNTTLPMLSFSYPAVFDHPTEGSASIGDEQYNSSVSYWQNITNGSPDLTTFKNTINWLAGTFKTFNVVVPNSPPGVCLFDAVNYRGNSQCFGLGGANLSAPIASKAKSLSLKGRAGVYLYSGFYGDLTSTYISTDVASLADVPDGSSQNFANRIKAMLVAQIS